MGYEEIASLKDVRCGMEVVMLKGDNEYAVVMMEVLAGKGCEKHFADI